MTISRRDFLKYCSLSAAMLGLSGTDLFRLEQVLANPNAPTVLWLHGSSCSGCSVSFLNYIATSDPTDAADILVNHINLAYHPTLMTAAGQTASQAAYEVYNKKPYILVLEGGVPTKFNGKACWPWTYNGKEETFQEVVRNFAGKAAKIVTVGTCAAWGGIPAAGENPTGVKGISAFLNNNSIINIGGCPPHPKRSLPGLPQRGGGIGPGRRGQHHRTRECSAHAEPAFGGQFDRLPHSPLLPPDAP